MTVTVRPFKKDPTKLEVDIAIKWTDGTAYRKRTVAKDPTGRPITSPSAAQRWGEHLQSRLLQRGPEKAPEAPKAAAPTLAAFAPEWVQKHHDANLHKRSGVDAVETILRLHLLPFVGGLPLDEVTDEAVADLRAKWIKGGQTVAGRTVPGTNSKKTINNRLSILSSLLHVAVEWKKIRTLPCTIRLLKVDDQREPSFYEHDTYERIVEGATKADPRILAAVLLAGDGGLRRGEIIGLDLSDVDFKLGRLIVRRSVYVKKGTRYVDEVKGGKAKAIPCTPRLLDALKGVRHLRGPRALYTDEGAELTPKIIRMWVQRAERLAGLPETGRLHVYRHTFCSHLAMAGVPAMTVKELARHTSLTTTMRYMHLSPSAKDEGIALLTRNREARATGETAETAPGVRTDPRNSRAK